MMEGISNFQGQVVDVDTKDSSLMKFLPEDGSVDGRESCGNI